jgi:dTDP-4-dehydrorhamnose reductase
MKPNILITGASGTVGQYLLPFLSQKAYPCIAWDRNKTSISNYESMEKFVLSSHAEVVIHLAAITSFKESLRKNAWQVNYEWPSELAWICRTHSIKFIFISSAMVFSQQQNGPFTLDMKPNEQHGYGGEKRQAEERVISQNPQSVILRLGWQIAEKGTNSMLHYLDFRMNENGKIMASTQLFPACSFVTDTVKIIEKSFDFEAGIYQLDSNKEWSLFHIAKALSGKFNKNWLIEASDKYHYDQRMIDERININPLSFHLDFS